MTPEDANIERCARAVERAMCEWTASEAGRSLSASCALAVIRELGSAEGEPVTNALPTLIQLAKAVVAEGQAGNSYGPMMGTVIVSVDLIDDLNVAIANYESQQHDAKRPALSTEDLVFDPRPEGDPTGDVPEGDRSGPGHGRD